MYMYIYIYMYIFIYTDVCTSCIHTHTHSLHEKPAALTGTAPISRHSALASALLFFLPLDFLALAPAGAIALGHDFLNVIWGHTP